LAELVQTLLMTKLLKVLLVEALDHVNQPMIDKHGIEAGVVS
jgi:hypothetical protein